MALPVRALGRVYGLLKKRLLELTLHLVPDPRKPRGRRWAFTSLLNAAFLGLVAGCKSLAEVERLTSQLTPLIRQTFGIPRRVPDTTLRDLFCKDTLSRNELVALLPKQVKLAHRRKALERFGLPFHMVAMDGKDTSLPVWDPLLAQQQGDHGVIRTITSTLVSARVKVCMRISPVPAPTNEMGHFKTALNELCQDYQETGLLTLISYDSGACSKENADYVREEKKLHYLFGLKANQPELHLQAQSHLAAIPASKALATTTEVRHKNEVVIRRLYLTKEMGGSHGWEHLKTVLRVESETQDRKGNIIEKEDRYFLCSLEVERLTFEQWLMAVRRHWGVENECHHTWDRMFEEDDHPWIEGSVTGMLAVLVLRRVAYNLMALFRGVTQRSEEARAMPWSELFEWFEEVLKQLRVAPVKGALESTATP